MVQYATPLVQYVTHGGHMGHTCAISGTNAMSQTVRVKRHESNRISLLLA